MVLLIKCALSPSFPRIQRPCVMFARPPYFAVTFARHLVFVLLPCSIFAVRRSIFAVRSSVGCQ